MTGLYSEKHGIVGNDIRDPAIAERFSLGAPSEVVNDPRWWQGGEPIWITAQKQGLRSGTLFWPGSEAKIQNMLPTYSLHFQQSMTNTDRVNNLLKWIDLPSDQRPHFMTLYFDTVDSAGHKYGPNSNEVLAALKGVDSAIGYLAEQLRIRKIFDDLNIIVVSDHGMAAIDSEKVINVSEVLTRYPNIERIAGGAVGGLFSNSSDEISQVVRDLKEHSTLYKVYKKNEIPARFHYQNSNRIPDVLIVAEEGAYISLKPSFFPSSFSNKGAHGYDNELASMQATFIASGPNFPQNLSVNTFSNVYVYAMMCKLLKIKAAPNEADNLRKLDLIRWIR